MKPQIILLNGTSSSGKTSLAKALQAILPSPYHHMCIDAYEDMMPARFGEGGAFEHSRLLSQAFKAMYGAIDGLAQAGGFIIVDHVLIENEEPLDWVPNYLAAVKPYPTFNVKVFAPLEILREREIARSDRPSGLAEWQSTRMHRSISYDLEIDTSKLSPESAATLIQQTLN